MLRLSLLAAIVASAAAFGIAPTMTLRTVSSMQINRSGNVGVDCSLVSSFWKIGF
jgi:hypothetical protein